MRKRGVDSTRVQSPAQAIVSNHAYHGRPLQAACPASATAGISHFTPRRAKQGHSLSLTVSLAGGWCQQTWFYLSAGPSDVHSFNAW
jgi:hypothetical protein